MKIGIGYDIHKFKKTHKLIIGGIQIPYHLGLKGYSDSDVLIHSICDAFIGAVSSGDIGKYFPNFDFQYKNISSLVLLNKTYKLIINKGLILKSLDSVVIVQTPKLSIYKYKIQNLIAKNIKVNPKVINIKATTNEYLGNIGKNMGIAAITKLLLI